ncbi:MAG: hypothetical protein QM817_37210 [Archangium sp.]
MRSRLPAVVIVVLSASAGAGEAGEIIVRDASDWTLTLPKGFEHMPKSETEVTPHWYGFRLGQPDFAVVSTQVVKGQIGKECADAETLKKKGKTLPEGFTVTRLKWGRFEVCQNRMIQRRGEIAFGAIYIEFPLKPQGMNLHITGPLENETALKALAAKLTPTVVGETYWE